jgi:hypothetical protein
MSELRIIDADAHVREDVNAIAEDLEPPFGTQVLFSAMAGRRQISRRAYFFDAG